ncbi:hypothetical protein BDV19DRAFT_354279 [Aspergillus venezuelensis]
MTPVNQHPRGRTLDPVQLPNVSGGDPEMSVEFIKWPRTIPSRLRFRAQERPVSSRELVLLDHSSLPLVCAWFLILLRSTKSKLHSDGVVLLR